MFEGKLLMRVTTVESGRSNNEIPEIFRRKSYYELYSIATPSFTSPHNLTVLLRHDIATTSKETQKMTRTEHLPERRPPQRKQLLRTTFDRYVLISPTIRSRNSPSTLHSNHKQQNAISNAYGPPPSSSISLPSSQRYNDYDGQHPERLRDSVSN